MTTPAPLPEHLLAFWKAFIQSTGRNREDSEAHFYEAFGFGDSAAMADELGELVLQGTKRATAASLWSYEAEQQAPPQPGHLSIVLNGTGQPLCLIETQSVEVVAFHEVTAEFAATEGEGDGSLVFWQQEHRAFFTRDCARLGKQFSEAMPVVCERFEVVFRWQG